MRSRRAVLSAIGQGAAGFGGRGGNPPQASPRPSRRLSGRCTLLGWPTMLLALAADAPRSFWLTALRPGVTMYFTDLPHFLDSTAAIGPGSAQSYVAKWQGSLWARPTVSN